MPNIYLASRRTHQLYRQYLKMYPSRRAAFRAAKRAARIPMGQHPAEVVLPMTDRGNSFRLDERNVRLYVFNLVIGAVAVEYHIREDKKSITHGQPKHFNAGKPPKKLKEHYYWDDKD